MASKIFVIEFGRNARLIARRIKKLGGQTKIVPPFVSLEEYKKADGIIISGSPFDIRYLISIILKPKIFDLGVPIMGICFGAQIITVLSGGKVETVKEQVEYGKFEMEILRESRIFEGLQKTEVVWMRHEDSITEVPRDFLVTAQTQKCIAAIEHREKPIYALQFHPEYIRTPCGVRIFRNFLDICRRDQD